MNLFEHRPPTNIWLILAITGFWTGLWAIIMFAQSSPPTRVEWQMVIGLVMGLNVFIFYLYFLRRWQCLSIDMSQNVISRDTRFLFPLKYKVPIDTVHQIEFIVTAIQTNANKNTKREKVLEFRNHIQDRLNESFPLAETIKQAIDAGHIPLKSPYQGVCVITAFRLRDKNDKLLAHAQLEGKKELKKFFGFFKSKNLKWKWKVIWR